MAKKKKIKMKTILILTEKMAKKEKKKGPYIRNFACFGNHLDMACYLCPPD